MPPPAAVMDRGDGQGFDPSPRSSFAPHPSMLNVNDGSQYEDTPSYRALAEAGILCTRYRRTTVADIFTGADFSANSSLTKIRMQKFWWCWYCAVGAPCYECTHVDMTVPPKHVGLLQDDKNDFLFAQPGIHSRGTCCGNLKKSGPPIPLRGHLTHGNRTIVIVEQGFIGLAKDNGQPVLLPPGIHVWTSESLDYEDSYPLDQDKVFLGPYTLVTVDEGYAAITSDNGQQKILSGGNTHLLTHKNWTFEKLLPLKIHSKNLESITCTSADNINLKVDSNVTWRIADPHLAATMAAETMSAGGGNNSTQHISNLRADITQIRRDVEDQARASLAAFVGGVNYSESFHMSAAAAHGSGSKAAENHTSVARPVAEAVLFSEPGEPEPEDEEAKIPTALAATDGDRENPLYDMTKMRSAVDHANQITQAYGVKIMGINIITAEPHDPKLTTALALGAVAAAEALQRETVARGDANSITITAEAEQRAEVIRAKGKATALEVEAEGAKRAEMLRAEGEAAGINSIATSISAEGGQVAMTQRIAESYVMQLGEMSKNSNMIIVPDRPNDVSGVVSTALSIAQSISSCGHAGNE